MDAKDKYIVDPDTPLQDNVSAHLSARDEPEAKFFIGQKVELLEDIKNDGTYPHIPVGALMIKKGAVGYVRSIGEFLMVVRVYEVHFLDADAVVEIIGCREHELLALEDYKDEIAEELEFMRKHREENYSK